MVQGTIMTLLLIFYVATVWSESALTISDMFKGGAVLQRHEYVPVWGNGAVGSQVHVDMHFEKYQDLSLTASVNSSGIWMVWLPPQNEAWNVTLTAHDESAKIQVIVSFGETILCAGQSNMGMQVGPSTRGFDADNATAEAAGSTRYSGRIFLHSSVGRWKAARGINPYSTTWYSVYPESIHNFSSVCWLTGRDLYDHMGGKVPVGLAMSAVGGHAIESWLGPNQLKICGISTNCVADQNISQIWGRTITPMQPFKFGSMIWDQGEQDLHCNRVDIYACLQEQLLRSYRQQFNSSFPFVAVQLPGYTDGVFPMRLRQEQAALHSANAAVVATYDDSCAMGKTDGCPHGNVHNVHKEPVGRRLALKLRAMKLGERGLVTEGPRADTATHTGDFVEVTFKGGTPPFYFAGTRNCTICCRGAESDFDVGPINGTSRVSPVWVNGTNASVTASGSTVRFQANLEKISWVRYTANKIFPQCALYNQEGLPALPFEMEVA